MHNKLTKLGLGLLAIGEKTYRWLVRRMYILKGRAPWSLGYTTYRNQFIHTALGDDDLIQRFGHNEELPQGYGIGLDERCVEYAWLFSRMDAGPGWVLDAGGTLNHDFILDHASMIHKKLYIMTLAPEAKAFWRRGISYLYEDIRQIPVRDVYYDLITCVSTLEHIGFDNLQYTGKGIHQEHQPDDFLTAVDELRRVLKPGGRLYLTVPFGRYSDWATQQVFDLGLLEQAIARFEALEVERVFYRYSESGWQISDAQACADCEYVAWNMQPRGRFPRQPDGAAAARAVACVALRTGE